MSIVTTKDQDALNDLVAPLVRALDALAFVQRHLHPALLGKLATKTVELKEPLLAMRENVARLNPHGDDATYVALDAAAHLVLRSVADLGDAAQSPEGIYLAYRAVRYLPYAQELLYPLCPASDAVNVFFTNTGTSHYSPCEESDEPDAGVFHVDNERGTKGGYSVYAPANRGLTPPLVVALHGGSGHGRSFLWTWLRDARSRGAVVVTPTSCGDTWALMEPDADVDNLSAILKSVSNRWKVDPARILLTGMSDGGTFTYLTGLRSYSPFTHLAPISASFHPMFMELIPEPSVMERAVYITHGVHDWMFQIDVARMANELLSGMGAEVTYREIADLAHTYPREENALILDWFLGEAFGVKGTT
jgi:phospholipase/carboxylesterase